MGYSKRKRDVVAEATLVAVARRMIILKLAEFVVDIGNDVAALRDGGLTEDANDLGELGMLADDIGQRFMKRSMK